MANINFAVFNAFRKAGVDEELAREAAEEITKLGENEALKQLQADMGDVKARLTRVDTRLNWHEKMLYAIFAVAILNLIKDLIG